MHQTAKSPNETTVPFLPFSSSLFILYSHVERAHRGYSRIFAFVSAVPACGVTYSRVQNESVQGGLQVVFAARLRLLWARFGLSLLQLPAD